MTFASCSCLFCFAKYWFIDTQTVAIVATEGTDFKYVAPMPAKSDPRPSRRTTPRAAATQPPRATSSASAPTCNRRRRTSRG